MLHWPKWGSTVFVFFFVLNIQQWIISCCMFGNCKPASFMCTSSSGQENPQLIFGPLNQTSCTELPVLGVVRPNASKRTFSKLNLFHKTGWPTGTTKGLWWKVTKSIYSSAVLNYNLEALVLYLSILHFFILFTFPPLHFRKNIVICTPLHLSDNCSYFAWETPDIITQQYIK